MREWQEIHHTVVLVNRHILMVCFHSSMELSHREDYAFGIARCTTGIEDIGNIVHRSVLLALLYLGLTSQALAQLQEVGERHDR